MKTFTAHREIPKYYLVMADYYIRLAALALGDKWVNVGRLDNAKQIFDLYYSEVNQAEKDEIERIRGDLGKDFCHRCRYCLPCDQEVQISDIMIFRSMARRLAPNIAVMLSKNAMESVDNCTDCEECLAKCPYNLAIPEIIREQRKAYDEVVAQL